MLNQELERIEFLQILADIIAFILGLFQPIVTPIGEFMVLWIDVVLGFFPTESLTFYIVIYVVLVISGAIVNIKWPGVKYDSVYTKEEDDDDDDEKSDIKKTGIDHLSRDE